VADEALTPFSNFPLAVHTSNSLITNAAMHSERTKLEELEKMFRRRSTEFVGQLVRSRVRRELSQMGHVRKKRKRSFGRDVDHVTEYAARRTGVGVSAAETVRFPRMRDVRVSSMVDHVGGGARLK